MGATITKFVRVTLLAFVHNSDTNLYFYGHYRDIDYLNFDTAKNATCFSSKLKGL